jgi:hypothetical protein
VAVAAKTQRAEKTINKDKEGLGRCFAHLKHTGNEEANTMVGISKTKEEGLKIFLPRRFSSSSDLFRNVIHKEQ